MELYKLGALNKYFAKKHLRYRFPVQSTHDLIFIKDQPIYVRMAKTSSELEKGLMGVASLDPNEGCLLCFGRATYISLWMKNCKLNLQAAMIDKDGIIVDLKDMSYKNPNVLHTSAQPASYALEMPENFFTDLGIRIGDRVRL